jgi:hypothetical protein
MYNKNENNFLLENEIVNISNDFKKNVNYAFFKDKELQI